MKLSITLTLVILAASILLGWQNHRQLTTIRETHRSLVEKADSLGFDTDAATSGTPNRLTHRVREDRRIAALDAAEKFIAFAREMETREANGDTGDPKDMQQRVIKLMDLMMSLDTEQLKTVIAEFRAATDLKEETRRGMVGFAIMTLASDNPQAALTIFTETADMFEKDGMGEHVAAMALAQWAKDDPVAAAKWVKENGKTHPNLVTERAINGLIAGTASQSPAIAFSLILDLKIEDSRDAVRKIASAATTDEQRDLFLTSFRKYLSALEDPEIRDQSRQDGFGQLADTLAKQSIDDATAWIDSASLSPEELADFAEHLNYHQTKENTGDWIEWIAESDLPEHQSSQQISNLVSNWTRQDYRAAGEWLATTPDGPAKQPAVQSYARTVAPYDPQTATQWALTLPAGDSRDSTLKSIYNQWPDDDEDAKNAFAETYGIND